MEWVIGVGFGITIGAILDRCFTKEVIKETKEELTETEKDPLSMDILVKDNKYLQELKKQYELDSKRYDEDLKKRKEWYKDQLQQLKEKYFYKSNNIEKEYKKINKVFNQYYVLVSLTKKRLNYLNSLNQKIEIIENDIIRKTKVK